MPFLINRENSMGQHIQTDSALAVLFVLEPWYLTYHT